MAALPASTTQIMSISLPRPLAKIVQKEAQKRGKSRSELFREALQRYFWIGELLELQVYGLEQSRKAGLQSEDVQRLIDEYRTEKQKKAANRR